MKSNDSLVTLQRLKDAAREFSDDRRWWRYHNIKELATYACVEAGELAELFLFKSVDEINQKLKDDPAFKERILEEYADILHILMVMSHYIPECNISAAFFAKLEKTAKKYPVTDWQ